MFKVDNLFNNKNVKVLDHSGMFAIVEYVQDRSVNKGNAIVEFFASKMNARRRQAVCYLKDQGISIQPNSVSWTLGNITSKSTNSPVSDILGKISKNKNAKESSARAEYFGSGYIVLEPSYKYLTLVDMKDWDNDLVIAENAFYACDAKIQQKTVTKNNLASVALGGDAVANLSLKGEGIVCVESNYPKDELIEIDIKDDILKVDGDMAVMWSGSLDFSVEKVARAFGPPTASDFIVNVYKGTGKIFLSPVSR